MSYSTITTVVKMLESLPDEAQERAAEHLREYLEELKDELRWAESFRRSSARLVEAAQAARHEVKQGKAERLDPNKL